MSRPRSIALVVGAAWICGACAHPQGTVQVVEALGPTPLLAAAAPAGVLRVYTPTEAYDDDDVLYDLHRGYSILTPDRELLKHVRNADHRWDETPARVSLPVGSYRIESPTLHGGIASVPVVVEQSRTTNVYLDGSFARRETRDGSAGLPSVAAGPGDVVTLPDGEIIGWGAGTARKR